GRYQNHVIAAQLPRASPLPCPSSFTVRPFRFTLVEKAGPRDPTRGECVPRPEGVEPGLPKPRLHFPYGWDAEGEIRTPEGLAAHQISSLARWTGLRYLSGSPSPEPGNTFSPPRRDDRNGATSSSKTITGWTSV